MEAKDIIETLVHPERIASVIGQLADDEHKEIADLVANEQTPGTFGDLIKRSMGLVAEAKQMEEAGMASLLGRQKKGE